MKRILLVFMMVAVAIFAVACSSPASKKANSDTTAKVTVAPEKQMESNEMEQEEMNEKSEKNQKTEKNEKTEQSVSSEKATTKQASTKTQPPSNNQVATKNDASAKSNVKVFTLQELANYNGKNGNPAYIAVEGKVYDVTNVAPWRGGRHNGYPAGKDYTKEIYDVSPHKTSVLAGLSVVGQLQ